jgi:hypothetical protein
MVQGQDTALVRCSIRQCGSGSITHSWRKGRRSRLRSGRLTAWRFKSSRVHHSCLRAVMPEACFQHDTPTLRAELASPSGQGIGLTHRHSQVRVLERAPIISRSSKAERPADNRRTAVRYRAGEPPAQTRGLPCPPPPNRGGSPPHPHSDGPGAFKPETVGQRAFNPCAKRFDSSRVLQPLNIVYTTSSIG